jgi:HEAT repeat protein
LVERKDARAADSVVRFLEDANESARFAAVGALIGQEAVTAHKDALVKALCQEDSVRVRNRIFEALANAGLSVQPEQERVKAKLTPGYALDGGFVPRKRG